MQRKSASLRQGDARARGDARISFEVFPPRDPAMEPRLWRAIEEFAAWSPDFISVTHSAGGSEGVGAGDPFERTRQVVTRISRETDTPPAAHITCAGASCEALMAAIRAYGDAGVRRLVVLRGDMPNMGAYVPREDGFQTTANFIAAIRGLGDFDISVSAYPEKHPDSASVGEGIDLLKRKVEAGACRAITQFVFETDCHLRYVEAAREAGLVIPIAHGIIMTTNFEGISRMARKCGASVPLWLARAYEGLEGDLSRRREVAVRVALEQCRRLYAHGSRHFHFYTLNQAATVGALCRALREEGWA